MPTFTGLQTCRVLEIELNKEENLLFFSSIFSSAQPAPCSATLICEDLNGLPLKSVISKIMAKKSVISKM